MLLAFINSKRRRSTASAFANGNEALFLNKRRNTILRPGLRVLILSDLCCLLHAPKIELAFAFCKMEKRRRQTRRSLNEMRGEGNTGRGWCHGTCPPAPPVLAGAVFLLLPLKSSASLLPFSILSWCPRCRPHLPQKLLSRGRFPSGHLSPLSPLPWLGPPPRLPHLFLLYGAWAFSSFPGLPQPPLLHWFLYQEVPNL